MGKCKPETEEEPAQSKLNRTEDKWTWAVSAAWVLDALPVAHFWGETLICPRQGFFLDGKQQHSFIRVFPNFIVHPLKSLCQPLLQTVFPSTEA